MLIFDVPEDKTLFPSSVFSLGSLPIIKIIKLRENLNNVFSPSLFTVLELATEEPCPVSKFWLPELPVPSPAVLEPELDVPSLPVLVPDSDVSPPPMLISDVDAPHPS